MATYRGEMTRRRIGAVAASLAVAVALLAGCSGGSTPTTPYGQPTLSAPPSKEADPGALPAGAAIDDWAAAVLPPDRAGGASAVARVSGEVSPDMDAVIDLTQPEGVWDVTIICQSADGSALTLTPAPNELNELKPLACSSPAAPDGGDHLTITFDGGSEGTLTLSADAAAVYVYEIRAHTAGQD